MATVADFQDLQCFKCRASLPGRMIICVNANPAAGKGPLTRSGYSALCPAHKSQVGLSQSYVDLAKLPEGEEKNINTQVIQESKSAFKFRGAPLISDRSEDLLTEFERSEARAEAALKAQDAHARFLQDMLSKEECLRNEATECVARQENAVADAKAERGRLLTEIDDLNTEISSHKQEMLLILEMNDKARSAAAAERTFLTEELQVATNERETLSCHIQAVEREKRNSDERARLQAVNGDRQDVQLKAELDDAQEQLREAVVRLEIVSDAAFDAENAKVSLEHELQATKNELEIVHDAVVTAEHEKADLQNQLQETKKQLTDLLMKTHSISVDAVHAQASGLHQALSEAISPRDKKDQAILKVEMELETTKLQLKAVRERAVRAEEELVAAQKRADDADHDKQADSGPTQEDHDKLLEELGAMHEQFLYAEANCDLACARAESAEQRLEASQAALLIAERCVNAAPNLLDHDRIKTELGAIHEELGAIHEEFLNAEDRADNAEQQLEDTQRRLLIETQKVSHVEQDLQAESIRFHRELELLDERAAADNAADTFELIRCKAELEEVRGRFKAHVMSGEPSHTSSPERVTQVLTSPSQEREVEKLHSEVATLQGMGTALEQELKDALSEVERQKQMYIDQDKEWQRVLVSQYVHVLCTAAQRGIREASAWLHERAVQSEVELASVNSDFVPAQLTTHASVELYEVKLQYEQQIAELKQHRLALSQKIIALEDSLGAMEEQNKLALHREAALKLRIEEANAYPAAMDEQYQLALAREAALKLKIEEANAAHETMVLKLNASQRQLRELSVEYESASRSENVEQVEQVEQAAPPQQLPQQQLPTAAPLNSSSPNSSFPTAAPPTAVPQQKELMTRSGANARTKEPPELGSMVDAPVQGVAYAVKDLGSRQRDEPKAIGPKASGPKPKGFTSNTAARLESRRLRQKTPSASPPPKAKSRLNAPTGSPPASTRNLLNADNAKGRSKAPEGSPRSQAPTGSPPVPKISATPLRQTQTSEDIPALRLPLRIDPSGFAFER